MSGCDALVLEANHCLGLLAESDYPYPLKQRIAGRLGHLNNELRGAAARIDTRRLKHVVAAHLSQQNNTPDKGAGRAGRRVELHRRLDRYRRPGRRVRLARPLTETPMEKRQELYKGKAKTVYATDDANRLIMHYRDDVSAFDGAKLAKLERRARRTTRSTPM